MNPERAPGSPKHNLQKSCSGGRKFKKKASQNSTKMVSPKLQKKASPKESSEHVQMASHYIDYTDLARKINALPQRRLEIVKSGCFKQVIEMLLEHKEEFNYEKKVDVSRFDPSTRELELPSGTKIRLVSKNPNLLKLSTGPFQFKQHLLVRDQKALNELICDVKYLYNFDLSEYKQKGTINDLWSELEADNEMSKEEVYIKFTLAFVNSFLAPASFRKVHLGILVDIIPVQRIDTLDWDGFTIDYLALGVQYVRNCKFAVLRGCSYLLIRAEQLVGRMEGVNSPPGGSPLDVNLLVHAGTNYRPFSGSTAVSDLETMSSSAMNDHELLVKELNDRRILIAGIKDLIKEPPGLEVEQGYEAHGGVHRNENEGDLFPSQPLLDNMEEYQQGANDALLDAGHVVAPGNGLVDDGSTIQEQDEEAPQPPVDIMEADQEVGVDQGGNNESADAGNVVVPGDDTYPMSMVDIMDTDQEVGVDQGGNNASADAGNVVVPAAQPPASFVAAPEDQIQLDGNHGDGDAGLDVIQAESDLEFAAEQVPGNGLVDDGSTIQEQDEETNMEEAPQSPAPFLAAPQDQVHLGDNHGNNQPLLDAAAGQGNEDEVIQAAHDDVRPEGRGHRKKILSVVLRRPGFILADHPMYPRSVTPRKVRGRGDRGRGGPGRAGRGRGRRGRGG